MKPRRQTGLLQSLIYLRPGPVDQHQAHAETVEQGDVMNDVGEILMLRGLTPQHQHEGLAPVRIDVGCGIPEPTDMGPARRCHCVFQAVD